MHSLGRITQCAAAGLILASGVAHADFSPVGDMEYARVGARSVRLADDSVLVIGGADNASPLASAERFDPSSGTFSKTIPMHDPRDTAIAVRLDLTPRAVERRVNAIFTKLGLEDDGAVNRRVLAALTYTRNGS